MNKKAQWDDDFLNNLKKGFEPLSKNDFSCIIMEADSSLMWILLRNAVNEPYQLIWKVSYAVWKDLCQTIARYDATQYEVYGTHWVCRYMPVGNVWLEYDKHGWMFTGTCAYFIKALQEADSNILKFTSLLKQ